MTFQGNFAAGLAGFFVALVVFVFFFRWAMLAYGAYQQAVVIEPANPRMRAIVTTLCQSLFHDGPWALLTLGFIASQIYSEPWALWFFIGFALAFGYMGLMATLAGLRIHSPRKDIGRLDGR